MPKSVEASRRITLLKAKVTTDGVPLDTTMNTNSEVWQSKDFPALMRNQLLETTELIYNSSVNKAGGSNKFKSRLRDHYVN